MTAKRLKLMALDEEDLQILSAHCQDAVLKTGGLRFMPREQRFIVELNRFVWEKPGGTDKEPERRISVLHFERVLKVTSSGINRKKPDDVLSMLAIVFQPQDKPAGTIELVFSGGAAVRLEVECVEAQLADMKASWSASSVPVHRDEN